MILKDPTLVEGIAGVWFYHLSASGRTGHPTLCGETRVMQTEAPLSTWGLKTHLNERFCEKCKEIYENMKLKRDEDNTERIII